ncbi:MAG: class I SAM-dependent methyltransferase [Gammaproteobacteria bacterium]|nr:class I SAM-dependent methyltransferase [Gammaproteobacteria bacterium]
MDTKRHWEKIYSEKSVDAMSWFQPHAIRSLKLIQRLISDKTAHIIDVGGGASTLPGDLLEQGYANIAVLDVSAAALQFARKRLGKAESNIHWLEGDVTNLSLPENSVDLWHDRAVFHFLTAKADRCRYVDTVLKSVRPGGYVLIATFAEDGPTKCSGLPVRRYSAQRLYAEFNSPFEFLGHEKELHQTPDGSATWTCATRASLPMVN